MFFKEYQISILIVDDDYEARSINEMELTNFFGEISKSELNIETADSIEAMHSKLNAQKYHLILLDCDLGEDENGEMINGIDHIPDILSLQPSSRLLMLSSFKDPQMIVKAMQLGATDFLNKGYEEAELKYRKEKVLKALKDARFEIELLRRSIKSKLGPALIKYDSKAMKSLDLILKDYSKVNFPVLITGEAGTGKSYTAKRLSELTEEYLGQKDRSFSDINVTALSSTLLESELFGHIKGSFTGAVSDKQGIFSIAVNGDLFLDEIGDASLELQAKLLKVIGENTYRPVGGKKDLVTNTRLIFATNKNLEKLIKEGKFRQDLYDRICACTFKMPSIAERKEDIPIICQSITDLLKEKHGKNISYSDFPEDLKRYFSDSEIQGQVRGIENELKKLYTHCKEKANKKLDYSQWKQILKLNDKFKKQDHGELETEELLDLLSKRVGAKDWKGLPQVKERLQRKTLLQAYDIFPKNTQIAKALGLSEGMISRKLKEYLQ